MLTKIFRFLGVPTKYDFPKKTRDVVLLELKTILEEKKHQVECLKAFAMTCISIASFMVLPNTKDLK